MKGRAASGPTDLEYTQPKNTGETTPAIAPTLLLAPCSWPCSDSDTRWVISDWMVGIASPHSALGSIAATNSQPVGASPMQAMPSAPKHRPMIIVRRSPKRRTAGPVSVPWTSMSSAPTMASSRPTCQAPQP